MSEKPIALTPLYKARYRIKDRAWMRERAIKYSSRAIKTIYEMTIDPRMPASVRMDGAKYIVDRAFGKAEQAIQLDASVVMTPTDVAPVAMQIMAAMRSVLDADSQSTDNALLIDATYTDDQSTDDVVLIDSTCTDDQGTDGQGTDGQGTDDRSTARRVSRWRIPKSDPVDHRGVQESTRSSTTPHDSKPSKTP